MVWQDMPSLDVSLDIPVGPRPGSGFRGEGQLREGTLGDGRSAAQCDLDCGLGGVQRGLGEYDTAGIANAVKAQDPTRLVNANSGVNCYKSRPDSMAGDVYDDHTYVGPGRPVMRDEHNDRPRSLTSLRFRSIAG